MTLPSFVNYVIAVTLDPIFFVVYLLFGFFARRFVVAIAGSAAWSLAVQGLYLLNPGTPYFILVPRLVGAVVTSGVVYAARRLSVAVWRRLSVSAES